MFRKRRRWTSPFRFFQSHQALRIQGYLSPVSLEYSTGKWAIIVEHSRSACKGGCGLLCARHYDLCDSCWTFDEEQASFLVCSSSGSGRSKCTCLDWEIHVRAHGFDLTLSRSHYSQCIVGWHLVLCVLCSSRRFFDKDECGVSNFSNSTSESQTPYTSLFQPSFPRLS